MKKVFNILMIAVILMPYFIVPSRVKADDDQTLGELKEELTQLEKDAEENENETQYTEQQIADAKENISQIKENVIQINEDIATLEEEIADLNEKIEVKKEEIKQILKFLQLSSGESAYLEYAFGAKDFTDFIYRAAVSEQLANYNDKLIEEFNQMIEDNEKKKIELNDKQEELDKKQKEYEELVIELGNKLDELKDVDFTIEEQIKARKKQLQSFEENGCSDDQTLKQCLNGKMAYTSELYRPIDYGWVTSRFGWRTYTLNGKVITDFHYSIDVSRSGWTVPVYSAGIGVVGAIIEKSGCGGNQVIVWHYVNGKEYTTMYTHLRSINVDILDVVTANTIIGTMGGNPATETWDTCSNGQHLDFAIMEGYFMSNEKDFSYSKYIATAVNPASVINFPSSSTYFADRYSIYN
ncbi:MAG: peptidoglycan DD-metalloendopeptidase family protein [Bacilli bacterium]|nr:peptidoglycan DD-metalloendopeptidase family protein [Bacilli bacterium]